MWNVLLAEHGVDPVLGRLRIDRTPHERINKICGGVVQLPVALNASEDSKQLHRLVARQSRSHLLRIPHAARCQTCSLLRVV